MKSVAIKKIPVFPPVLAISPRRAVFASSRRESSAIESDDVITSENLPIGSTIPLAAILDAVTVGKGTVFAMSAELITWDIFQPTLSLAIRCTSRNSH